MKTEVFFQRGNCEVRNNRICVMNPRRDREGEKRRRSQTWCVQLCGGASNLYSMLGRATNKRCVAGREANLEWVNKTVRQTKVVCVVVTCKI